MTPRDTRDTQDILDAVLTVRVGSHNGIGRRKMLSDIAQSDTERFSLSPVLFTGDEPCMRLDPGKPVAVWSAAAVVDDHHGQVLLCQRGDEVCHLRFGLVSGY